jgi:Uma2 family endonuclease
MALEAGIARHRFTVDDYHRMIDAGLLTKNHRVELIRGEIVEMAPQGSRHAGCVSALNRWLILAAGERALVRPKLPLTLPPDSEPEPDLVMVRRRLDFYRSAHPEAGDVFLVVEVAESGLRFDRSVKVPLYAEQGIGDVWIIDIDGEVIEVYREPTPAGYRRVDRLDRGASIAPDALPDIVLSVSDILG